MKKVEGGVQNHRHEFTRTKKKEDYFSNGLYHDLSDSYFCSVGSCTARIDRAELEKQVELGQTYYIHGDDWPV